MTKKQWVRKELKQDEKKRGEGKEVGVGGGGVGEQKYQYVFGLCPGDKNKMQYYEKNRPR